MDYEDRISIVTPEGVTLELSLAGIGSRFLAALLDVLVRVAILTVVLLVLGNLDTDSVGVVQAGGLVVVFFLFFGYDILFETLGSGRTPGKRWAGIRVVMVGGGAIGFWPSTVRNLLRLIDSQPGFLYVVGSISILATAWNQRLGDLAAGALVVRERKVAAPWISPTVPTPAVPVDADHWDLTGMTAEHLATIRRFLERRNTLAPDARARLAAELAARLRPVVVGPDARLRDEEFLEAVAAAKAARS